MKQNSFLIIFLVLVSINNLLGFILPFNVINHAATTNITKGGQTLEQTGSYFVANLTIGSNKQLFTVIIDTSSSDLIVPDVSCPAAKTTDSCYGKRRFNQTLSSTYQNIDNNYYRPVNNLGTFIGKPGQDVVVIGDRAADLITVSGLKFLKAQALGKSLSTLKADGVLGLAFTAKSQINGQSPFEKAVKQGDVQESFFSIWLEHVGQTNDLGTHGVIYYGGLDPVHCAPNAQYFPLSSIGFYQLTVVEFLSASLKTNSISQPVQAVIDSTQAYIGLPPKYLNAVQTSIGKSPNTVLTYPIPVDCSLKITLKLTFTGASAIITERDLVTKTGNSCVLGIVKADSIVIGVPFLRGRCTYFDVVRQRIGITPALLQD